MQSNGTANNSGKSITYWAGYAFKCAVLTLAMIYLIYFAEFEPVAAIYEAY